MQLSAYLDRIGFDGPVNADLTTLTALHRAHQLAVPFENLDVQLRRPTGLDAAASYDKIVRRRRGGWCYEMNGLMEWVLREVGFEVRRISAGVMRERLGDAQLGNHLCLLVTLDRPYLVDVGFGGSLYAPLPLDTVNRDDPPYSLSLGETGHGFWRFSEHANGSQPFSFDFRVEPADEALFAAKCRYLQTDEASSFVQTLVVQRRSPDAHVGLRGRVLTITRSSGARKTLLETADDLVLTLRDRFDLDVPEAATLWPAVCARHDRYFASGDAGSPAAGD